MFSFTCKTVKELVTFFTQCIHEKEENDEPLPVLIYKSQCSSVAMIINDVYCNDKYSIVKTRPLHTIMMCIVMTNILLSKPVHCILVVTDSVIGLGQRDA